MTVAASFGLAAALSVVVLGDESGYTAGQNQKMKIAAIEAMWHTEPAPASFTIVGLPDMKAHETRYAIRVPWVLGLIATRSLDGKVAGIDDLVAIAAQRIQSGILAYKAMLGLRGTPDDPALRAAFDAHVGDLGYALLLKRYTPAVIDATPAQIQAAAWDTVPPVPELFWSFRVMVGLGFYFIALFAVMFWQASSRQLERRPLVAAPVPVVVAAALGRGGTRAGMWRKSAASRGRSTACCRHSCRSRACPPRTLSSRWPASSFSIPCWRSWRCS